MHAFACEERVECESVKKEDCRRGVSVHMQMDHVIGGEEGVAVQDHASRVQGFE